MPKIYILILFTFLISITSYANKNDTLKFQESKKIEKQLDKLNSKTDYLENRINNIDRIDSLGTNITLFTASIAIIVAVAIAIVGFKFPSERKELQIEIHAIKKQLIETQKEAINAAITSRRSNMGSSPLGSGRKYIWAVRLFHSYFKSFKLTNTGFVSLQKQLGKVENFFRELNPEGKIELKGSNSQKEITSILNEIIQANIEDISLSTKTHLEALSSFFNT